MDITKYIVVNIRRDEHGKPQIIAFPDFFTRDAAEAFVQRMLGFDPSAKLTIQQVGTA